MKMIAKTKNKKVLSPQEIEKRKAEKKIKRKTRQFKNKIKYIFTMSGFKYINSEDHHMKIGFRDIELDAIFLYENIMIICEDTGSGLEHIKDHIRKNSKLSNKLKQIKMNFLGR